MITAGDILNGGFRLLIRHPLAVLVWALVHAAFGLASVALVFPRMAGMMRAMANFDPDAPPQAMQAAMVQNMGGVQSLSWAMSFAGYFVAAVLMCAAFRAVLRPQEGGFAFLRIGKDELRMFLMMLIVWIGGMVAAVIFILIVALVGFLIAFLLRDAAVIAALLIVLLVIAAIAAMVYVMVRLTMMFPFTYIRRDLVIDEAWSATRGRFWTLFLPYLAIMLITWVVTSIVMAPMMMSMMNELFAQIGQLPHTDTAADQAQVRQAVAAFFEHMAGQTWLWGGMIVLLTAINGISLALYAGAMATAARGLLADMGKLPEDIALGDAAGN